jgi:hypothetical protein
VPRNGDINCRRSAPPEPISGTKGYLPLVRTIRASGASTSPPPFRKRGARPCDRTGEDGVIPQHARGRPEMRHHYERAADGRAVAGRVLRRLVPRAAAAEGVAPGAHRVADAEDAARGERGEEPVGNDPAVLPRGTPGSRTPSACRRTAARRRGRRHDGWASSRVSAAAVRRSWPR